MPNPSPDASNYTQWIDTNLEHHMDTANIYMLDSDLTNIASTGMCVNASSDDDSSVFHGTIHPSLRFTSLTCGKVIGFRLDIESRCFPNNETNECECNKVMNKVKVYNPFTLTQLREYVSPLEDEYESAMSQKNSELAKEIIRDNHLIDMLYPKLKSKPPVIRHHPEKYIRDVIETEDMSDIHVNTDHGYIPKNHLMVKHVSKMEINRLHRRHVMYKKGKKKDKKGSGNKKKKFKLLGDKFKSATKWVGKKLKRTVENVKGSIEDFVDEVGGELIELGETVGDAFADIDCTGSASGCWGSVTGAVGETLLAGASTVVSMGSDALELIGACNGNSVCDNLDEFADNLDAYSDCIHDDSFWDGIDFPVSNCKDCGPEAENPEYCTGCTECTICEPEFLFKLFAGIGQAMPYSACFQDVIIEDLYEVVGIPQYQTGDVIKIEYEEEDNRKGITTTMKGFTLYPYKSVNMEAKDEDRDILEYPASDIVALYFYAEDGFVNLFMNRDTHFAILEDSLDEGFIETFLDSNLVTNLLPGVNTLRTPKYIVGSSSTIEKYFGEMIFTHDNLNCTSLITIESYFRTGWVYRQSIPVEVRSYKPLTNALGIKIPIMPWQACKGGFTTECMKAILNLMGMSFVVVLLLDSIARRFLKI